MFILGIVVDVVDNLLRLRYRHDLAVCHVVVGVGNYVGLFMKPPFPIVQVNGYILLNKPGESKDYINPF